MPKLGLTMETGAVEEWLVSEGQQVSRGEVIAEIKTEKIAYDLEAETDGVIQEFLVELGEEVPTGTPILLMS